MTAAAMYELEMIIKEGSYVHPCSKNYLYVETSIDGVVLEEDKTQLIKQENGRIVWNKHISKTFSTLEPVTPTMISLSMYKKKHFQQGFKLIGTSHFSISELIPILNKGSVQGRIQLNVKKNMPSTSNFLLALNLKSIPHSETRSQNSGRKSSHLQTSPSLDNSDDIEAAVDWSVPVAKDVGNSKVTVTSFVGPLTLLFLLLLTVHMISTSVRLFI